MRIGEAYQNPEVSNEEAERRVSVAELWVNAVESVSKMSQNETASRLFRSYLTDCAVCIPQEVGVLPVRGPEVPTVFIVPILNGEEYLSESTRMVATSRTQAARFTENTPGRIYIDATTDMSDTWRGLVLLHEVGHAARYDERGDDKQTSDGHWLEEVEMFSFEQQVLRDMFGDRYDNPTQERIQEAVEVHTSNRTKGTVPVLKRVDDYDRLFGPSLSDSETKARYTVIWLDIVFSMFDHVYPENSNLHKVAFLRRNTM